LKTGVGMTTAGFAWLYPLRFAGDGGNPMGIAPTRGRRDSSLPRVLGVSPNFLTTPKIEDPSQEEWGNKGVERDHYGQSLGEHMRWIPCQETV
jgi:hypothetical protein